MGGSPLSVRPGGTLALCPCEAGLQVVLLLFLPLCQVASSFNNLTRLHYRYVLLPAPALVLCSILQKPGARSPLISKMFYRATLQAAISCITS